MEVEVVDEKQVFEAVKPMALVSVIERSTGRVFAKVMVTVMISMTIGVMSRLTAPPPSSDAPNWKMWYLLQKRKSK